MLGLPTGTVTFLFTDIEGSTRLLEQFPTAYPAALIRHDAIMREAVKAHAGIVFETVGDAFYASFSRPSDAIAAALAAQLALDSEPWGPVGSIKVRIGLHLGEVEVRGEHYFGAALYRCARLMAVGHGGQTLLSGATADLVRPHLPTGVGLRDLGVHRLKDLSEPERVYQLAHAELPADFPPLRSVQARPNNLPVPATSFVGRHQDLIDIIRLLGEARLVTLVGPPGVGKTRLALQVATQQVGKPRDGVWLVELAPLADPELVPQAVASAITERQQPGRLLAESLVGELQGRDVLLVVDNCEHLLEGVAGLVGVILARCPEVRMLLTSRERLGLAGEVVVQVAPLRMPHIAGTLPLETLRQFDAVHLFADRATLVLPHFTVSPENAETVVQICRRLEGMPLALELAAAHMNAISPEGMLARLGHRFRLLGRSRGATGHHRTLRAALDWSHELLAEEEKVLFRRLSVFVGDWRLESAEAICGFAPLTNDEDVVLHLSRLVDKSLVTAEPGTAAGAYRLLETVREYARERLTESGELETVRGRHARHFLSLSETGRPLLRSPEHPNWLARLIQEEGNLRAALDWSAGSKHTEAVGVGLRLATALGPFWESRGLYSEGRRWLDLFLEQLPARTAERGRALFWDGWLTLRASEADAALARGYEGRSIAEELGDSLLQAMTLLLLGYTVGLLDQGKAEDEYLEQSEQLFASLGELRGLAIVLAYRSDVPRMQGDLSTANALADRGLAVARQANMHVGSSVDTSKNLVLLELGDLDVARVRWQEGLRRPGQEAVYIRVALMGLAGVAAAQGRARRALRLEATGIALKQKWGLHTGPAKSPLDQVFARHLEPAKQALDDKACEQAAAEGRLMSEEEAIEYALSDRD